MKRFMLISALVLFSVDIPLLHGDEAMIGLVARKLNLEGLYGITFCHFYSLPEPFFYLPAVTMKIFGDNLFGLRMSSFITSMGVMAVFFSLIKRWFSEDVAFYTGLLFLCNLYFLQLTGIALQFGTATFCSVLLIYLIDRANVQKYFFVLVGLLLGMSQYLYTANAALPFIFVIFQLVYCVNHKISKTYCFFSIVFVTILSSIIVYPLLKHTILINHTDHIMLWGTGKMAHTYTKFKTDNFCVLAYNQVKYSFGGIFLYGEYQLYGTTSILNKWAFLLFSIGLLWIRDYRVACSLIATIMITFLGVTLAGDPPFFPHFAGILPFLFVITAFGVNWLYKEKETILSVIVALALLVTLADYRQYVDVFCRNHVHYARTLVPEYDRIRMQDVSPDYMQEMRNSETGRFLTGRLLRD